MFVNDYSRAYWVYILKDRVQVLDVVKKKFIDRKVKVEGKEIGIELKPLFEGIHDKSKSKVVFKRILLLRMVIENL